MSDHITSNLRTETESSSIPFHIIVPSAVAAATTSDVNGSSGATTSPSNPTSESSSTVSLGPTTPEEQILLNINDSIEMATRKDNSLHELRIHLSSNEEDQSERAHRSDRGDRKENLQFTPTTRNSDIPSLEEDVGLTVSSVDRHPKLRTIVNHLDTLMIQEEKIAKEKKKKIRKYYEIQNALVEGYKGVIGLLDGGMSDLERQDAEADRSLDGESKENRSHTISRLLESALIMSIVMILLKVFIAIWSGSIAIVASAVDSVLDLVSQGGLVVAARFMKKKDAIHYPIGKSRVESLAILCFAIIMIFAAVYLMQESALVLQKGLANDPPQVHFDNLSIGIMSSTVLVQSFVYLICRRLLSTLHESTSNIGAVEALSQDQMNDVIVNVTSSIAAGIATVYESAWFVDPIVGLVVSLYMFIRWAMVVHEQFTNLIGRTADGIFLSKLIYLATIHDDRILKVDTVLGYKLGTKYHCEVDIVLPGDMPLRIAHDIGESLQTNIEKMDEVELAWVHADFEWQHKGEHDRWNL